MRVHLDVLGWLYVLCGAFGILTGASLGVLAFGTTAALADLGVPPVSTPPAVWLLLICGATLVIGGLLMIVVGRDVLTRGRFGRRGAMLLAVPNLFLIPFGTALGIYAFWALLNDETRREFGQPLRGAP